MNGLKNDVIACSGLTKAFKDVQVLKDVDLNVGGGEIFALLGANGAGKTTMIKIFSTLLSPDAGKVSICGFDVRKQPEKIRGKISLTGQFTAVDDILTGRENLRMIAELRGIKDVNQTIENLLRRFELTEAADRRAGTYSGGMKRRLDIAMSLIGSPDIIFLDEPTTGLDPSGRLEVWKTVKELATSGTTIFLTTQYLEEAEQLADRIAILNEGHIIANGTLDELKELLPPTEVKYVEQKPSLEEVFLAVTKGKKGKR